MTFFQAAPELANQFDDDVLLREYLERTVPDTVRAPIEAEARELGALAAGELTELAHAARRDEPVLVPFDAWGRRIDRIDVPDAWRRYARVAAERGLVALAYERASGRHSRVHQFALVHLFAPSSHVYTCPLAMTDGAARALEIHRPSAVFARAFPRLVSRDPAVAWTSGQWMTERRGGSDVGQTETVARRDGEAFRLYGSKWFSSATTSEMALTLARPEGNPAGGKGLALFYLETRGADGALNGLVVRRLKEKLGTRMLPTAELELDGAVASPVAGLSDGVKAIAPMLQITRTWNAVCSVASMRRGLALARDYARRRVAFGAPLAEKPLHVETLARLSAEYEAAFLLVFRAVELLGLAEAGGASAGDALVLRALTPLVKLYTGKLAVAHASEALELFGGQGYVEDTGLPQLSRDAQVLSIWEGTTNVLCLDLLRALAAEGTRPALATELDRLERAARSPEGRTLAGRARRDAELAFQWYEAVADRPGLLEAQARVFAFALARSFSLLLLVEHAEWLVTQRGLARSLRAAERLGALPRELPRDSYETEHASEIAFP